jgi:hypothetical protein
VDSSAKIEIIPPPKEPGLRIEVVHDNDPRIRVSSSDVLYVTVAQYAAIRRYYAS